MGYVSRACEYKRGWGDGRGYSKKEAKRQFVIRSFESRYGKLDKVSRKRINRFDEEQLDKLITILLPSPPFQWRRSRFIGLVRQLRSNERKGAFGYNGLWVARLSLLMEK